MSRVTMIALAGVIATGCEAHQPSDEPIRAEQQSLVGSAGSAAEEELERPIRHPLQESRLPDGRIPTIHVQDSPSGDRYLVMDSGWKATEDGPVQTHSRVTVARRFAMTAAERAAKPLRHEAPRSKLSMRLRTKAAAMRADEFVRVAVDLEREGPRYIDAVNEPIARGEILTEGDARAYRANFVAERRERIKLAQSQIRTTIEQLGGEVLDTCENVACLSITLPVQQLQTLAAQRSVRSLDLPTESPQQNNQVNGQTVSLGTQIYYNFLQDELQGTQMNYDGYVYPDRLRFAIWENAGPNDEHFGFRDNTTSTARFATKYWCDTSGTCNSDIVSDYTTEDDHAGWVLGLIMGDIRDGQDSTYAQESYRIQRSGYAGEASVYFFSGTGSVTEWQKAVDTMMSLSSPAPNVANFSTGWSADEPGNPDPTCTGDDTYSEKLDALFEDGILPIRAAGNDGDTGNTDCRIGPPNGQGTFTVGSSGTNPDSEADIRTQGVSSFSSSGGTTTEGEGRTIVDILAPGYRYRLYTSTNSGSGAYSTYTQAGTSLSAPTVTGAALDFIDWFRTASTDLINDPGVLTVDLLTMGDRINESGGKMTAFYDNRTGAGRLKMRKWNDQGLDGPWAWATGWVCVDDGEHVQVAINDSNSDGVSEAINTDVNMLKAAIFWYDNTGSIDDVDLWLKRTSGSTLASSRSSYDEKERVYSTTVGGETLVLDIEGYDIADNNSACSPNNEASMKVYYAYFMEDSDREAAEYLTWAEVE